MIDFKGWEIGWIIAFFSFILAVVALIVNIIFTIIINRVTIWEFFNQNWNIIMRSIKNIHKRVSIANLGLHYGNDIKKIIKEPIAYQNNVTKEKEELILKFDEVKSSIISEKEELNTKIELQKEIINKYNTFDKNKVFINLKNLYLYKSDKYYIRYNIEVINCNISEIEIYEYSFNILINGNNIIIAKREEIAETIKINEIIPENEYSFELPNHKWEEIKDNFHLSSSEKEYVSLCNIFYTLKMKIKETNTMQTHTIEYKDKITTFKNVMRGRL